MAKQAFQILFDGKNLSGALSSALKLPAWSLEVGLSLASFLLRPQKRARIYLYKESVLNCAPRHFKTPPEGDCVQKPQNLARLTCRVKTRTTSSRL